MLDSKHYNFIWCRVSALSLNYLNLMLILLRFALITIPGGTLTDNFIGNNNFDKYPGNYL